MRVSLFIFGLVTLLVTQLCQANYQENYSQELFNQFYKDSVAKAEPLAIDFFSDFLENKNYAKAALLICETSQIKYNKDALRILDSRIQTFQNIEGYREIYVAKHSIQLIANKPLGLTAITVTYLLNSKTNRSLNLKANIDNAGHCIFDFVLLPTPIPIDVVR